MAAFLMSALTIRWFLHQSHWGWL